jgi:lysozyme
VPRDINILGLRLIKSFESLSLTPYQDGGGVWGIGYGHAHGVTATTPPITQIEACQLLKDDLADAENSIAKHIHVYLSDNQYAALVSLVYNCGIAPLVDTLGTYLNASNYNKAAEEFLRWNHIDGVVSDGLTRRREAEKTLFQTT